MTHGIYIVCAITGAVAWVLAIFVGVMAVITARRDRKWREQQVARMQKQWHQQWREPRRELTFAEQLDREHDAGLI